MIHESPMRLSVFLLSQNYNLGLGRGLSVMELMEEFEKISGIKVPYSIEGRRVGDVATLYCDPCLAEKELGWRAGRDVQVMCE